MSYNFYWTNFPYTQFQKKEKFAGSASQQWGTTIRGLYLQCGLASGHFKGTVKKRSTSTTMLLMRSCTKHWYSKDIGIQHPSQCFNCTPTSYNPFNRCCQMTKLNKWYLQICLCWNQKKMYNGFSVFCGQAKFIFYCVEQLTHTTLVSGQRRTHMNTQRNTYTHVTVWCGLPRKFFQIPFTLKSLV